MAPKYLILPPGGYPDTQADYIPSKSIKQCQAIARRFCDGYLDPAGAHVYSGEREPWNESDPYPDWVTIEGPRGGMSWERA